jgi:hypothetical protein
MIRRAQSGARGTWAARWAPAKRPLKPQQVWAIRFRLDRERRLRDRAMFELAIDSKLRGCDIVKVKTQANARIRITARLTGATDMGAKQTFVLRAPYSTL